MNIQKIFKSVDADEMNSPLPSIVRELEQQGYKVKIEGVDFSIDEAIINLFVDLEQSTNEFNVEILKEGLTQKFKLVFTGYHKFIIQN